MNRSYSGIMEKILDSHAIERYVEKVSITGVDPMQISGRYDNSRVASCQLQVASCQLRVGFYLYCASCELRVASCELVFHQINSVYSFVPIFILAKVSYEFLRIR